MAAGRRTNPAQIRADRQKIADDIERRLRISTQGDIVDQHLAPPSPPEKGLPLPQFRRKRRISSQGIAGFKKGSNII